MRNLLVVGQVAISFMLLISAGLMIRSFIKLQLVDAGYNGDHVLTANVPLNFSKYKGNNDAVRSFFDQVLEKLKLLPGVQGAAANSGAPLAPVMPFRFPIVIEGRPVATGQAKPEAHGEVATPDAFRLLGVPLLSGRFFDEHDTPTTPSVVVISQGLARHYFPNENPIDKRISGDGEHWSRIVGVVGDVKQFGLDQDPVDTVYEAFEQSPGAFSLLIKTVGDPMSYVKQVRQVVYSVDPTQPITDIKTLDELRGDTLAGTRLTSLLLGLFAALALAIAATGLSGVTALLVSQRTREIGIRLALGAQRGQVLRMVLIQGMRVILIGLAVGLVGALVGTRVMKALLFDTAVTDPVTFAGVALVLLAVALLASYIPARRVTRVDPMIALRAE
jgi:predicted permease